MSFTASPWTATSLPCVARDSRKLDCFLSILVTFFGLNVSDFLLSLMGSDQAGIILTRKYLDVIFYGTIIVLIQISLNGTLNAQGDTKSYRNV